ncbi:Hypothetical predicted protein [Olea europaea subsp. europaea]|uniref:Uncharacterized protein n=1 Tax=Olea europaea subsp. europaea TaxID=158383 RepID=A0A8S0UPK7_OLEEU|nr:Hypothetical predicted protein [Olea europaea subsp. europaea]
MYVTVLEDDSDFVDSEKDVEDEDDTLYDQNVTDGIEMGLDGHDQVQDERGEGNDMEVDDLEYPTEELLSQCSSDDESGFRFPQFFAETDMKNLQFEQVTPQGKSSFCCMPTPMVTREAERDRIAPGPIVTMPISDEYEVGQPVADTVEVNFEEMGDKNCERAQKHDGRKRKSIIMNKGGAGLGGGAGGDSEGGPTAAAAATATPKTKGPFAESGQ